ncbi:hypothetical protein [Ferribacterium limneticum]|uniref:hypothetical protein n=1 Tax=Ferribacterium limneticum TaxID=76259 RepID=UPI001CF8FEAA|nr:hypothetical protein [Ferribacterium limneticum]UCV26786.1 hypothetical protein KI617_10735 [Ferribacterium limneticum]UCV30703.1 hypothetical protein KI608_10735 [Ferribacterium limneticum]
MREFIATSPDLSAAVFAYTRSAITSKFTAYAKNPDGTFNPEATSLLQQLITRFNVLPNYDNGYASMGSMTGISESLVKECMSYGAMACELVLDKARLPAYIQPLSVTHIKFYPDSKGILRPKQELSGNKVDLDNPCFFYMALDQDLLQPYASSPMEPALQPSLFAAEFLNDIRRVVQTAIHPRLHVTIDEAKLSRSIPAEAQHDPVKKAEWVAGVVAQIKDSVTNLAPDEALVTLDSLGINLLNNGNISLADEYKIIRDISDAKLATGAKTLPAILGHGTMSSNIASTETMLFMRNAQGVQTKVNELYSRLFTLALRLYGMDVYVEFAYAPIDLRPEAEMETFKSLKQSRVLELLSIGMLTDDEACLDLTGHLPPQGYKPLAGTMFKSKSGATDSNPNGDSNSGSTLNQNLNSDAPKGVKGQNKKADPMKANLVAIAGGN